MSQYQFAIAILLVLTASTHGEQEDSLRGALDAVDRRQRDLNSGGDAYNLAKHENRKAELEKALYDYLENQQDYVDQDDSVTSSFRERAGKAKLSNYRTPQSEGAEELLHKYRKHADDNDEIPSYRTVYKRYGFGYNTLGYNGVGMKKKRRMMSPVNLEDAEVYLPYGNDYNVYKPLMQRRVPYYPVAKRFPVSKRSSSPPVPGKTDPQVEKELSQIFGSPKKSDAEEKQSKKVMVTTPKPKTTTAKVTQKDAEVKTTVATHEEKPLQMKKKSIKWSDYWGIDRRKKSTNLDNEWLLDRYHQAVAAAKRSSSTNYPLRNFHNHDEPSMKRKDTIDRLDEKLKNIEESIIDDTLKFTGAHDDVDSKEMQAVKDSIIARLATAYNVEKMRKALAEYRQSLEQRQYEWEDAMNDELDDINEEKRVAVPRKQAIDESAPLDDEDNTIKCTEGDENCAEQTYKVPGEFMEQVTFEKGRCERIERACKDVSLILGGYGNMFEIACNMHQMCMLCSDNSWFSPTRQCNILFLGKADQLCDGNMNCQRAARESIKYLAHVDRNIRADLDATCHLECPDKR